MRGVPESLAGPRGQGVLVPRMSSRSQAAPAEGEDREEVKEALFLKGERVEERAFWTPLCRRLRRWEARDMSWRAVVEDARRRRCCASRTITS